MKSSLILTALLATVALLALQARAGPPGSGKPVSAAGEPPPATGRTAGMRQLSAEERAVLRRQLYQYRTLGKAS